MPAPDTNDPAGDKARAYAVCNQFPKKSKSSMPPVNLVAYLAQVEQVSSSLPRQFLRLPLYLPQMYNDEYFSGVEAANDWKPRIMGYQGVGSRS